MPNPLHILAAGSLKAALSEYAGVWPGEPPVLLFGPAGLLRQRIEAGQACDVYLSANMEHPQALARSVGTTCRRYARNSLCVAARLEAGLRPDNLLDRLLDPRLRLGTSTPGADPSGDYALEMFRRAEAVRPGAQAQLRAKAVPVVGATIPAPGAPSKEGGIMQLFADGSIDAFICYRTTALALPSGLQVVTPPAELAVTAEYGLTILHQGEQATAFADGLQAAPGLAILVRHGFDRP